MAFKLIIALSLLSLNAVAQDIEDKYLKDTARIELDKRVEAERYNQQKKLMEIKLQIEKDKLKKTSNK